MGVDHGVPIAGGDTAQHPLPVGLGEVGLGHGQDISPRVKPVESLGPLINQVVRDHNHRFPDQPHALQFHGRCNGRKCLAGTDDVVVESLALQNGAPDCVVLMRAHRDGRAFADQRDMRAIEFWLHVIVQVIIVVVNQRLPAIGIMEYPVLELFLDLTGFVIGCLRLIGIDNLLAVGVRIGNLDHLVVQDAVKQFVRRPAWRPPPVCIGNAIVRLDVDAELAVTWGRDDRHLGFVTKEVADKILDVFWINP